MCCGHSFVSTAADLDVTESSIAALVGHATKSMTGRYTHRSDASLLAAADKNAGRIQELMGDVAAPARRPRVRPDPAAVAAYQAELAQAA